MRPTSQQDLSDICMSFFLWFSVFEYASVKELALIKCGDKLGHYTNSQTHGILSLLIPESQTQMANTMRTLNRLHQFYFFSSLPYTVCPASAKTNTISFKVNPISLLHCESQQEDMPKLFQCILL